MNACFVFRSRFVRVDYVVKSPSLDTLKSPSNAIFEKFYGKVVNSCVSYEALSLYIIEPRSSDKDIYQALEKAWHQSNGENFAYYYCSFLILTYLSYR